MPAHRLDEDYRLVLNTGRVRDQWHTMTRTGLSHRLATHVAEPFVDLHPQDALLCGVREHELARITSRWGSCVARVKLSGEMPRGSVFVPIHWNGQFASDARAGALVNPVVDPVSGEPEFKHTPVRVEPFMVAWHGFALTRDGHADPLLANCAWWTRITGAAFTRFEVAGRQTGLQHGLQQGSQQFSWSARARAMLGATDPDADWLEFEDRSAGLFRGAWIVDGQLSAALFISPRPDLPSRAWLGGLFAKPQIDTADRMALLIGEPLTPGADGGVTVCSCFGIGRKTIEAAVREGCVTPQSLGARLKCGTNCGSCVPELKAIIVAARTRDEASRSALGA